MEEHASIGSYPGPGKVIRRTIAVFLGTAAVIGFLWYIFDGSTASRCVILLETLFENHSGGSCGQVRVWVGFPLFNLVIAAISVVLWTAPWQRFLGERARPRAPHGSLHLRRRMTQGFGIVLVGLGAGVIVSSLAGSFAGDSECGWYELWCSSPDGFFAPVGWFGPIREGPFALSRMVGIGFGVAAIGWGVTEIRSSGRGVRWLMVRLLGGAGLMGVLAFGLRDPLAFGWPGFVLSVLLVAAAVGVARKPQPVTTIPSLMTLFATMALTIAFGAWLQWELQGALSLGGPAGAAGGYLSYVRWKVRAPHLTDGRGEAAYQIWSQEQAR